MSENYEQKISELQYQIDDLEYQATVLEIASNDVQRYLELLKIEEVTSYIKYVDILKKHEENEIVLIDDAYMDCLFIINRLRDKSEDVREYIDLSKISEVKDYQNHHKTIGALKYRQNGLKRQLNAKVLIKMMTC